MKKQAGFSLIELVVAMAVLALIMGAMVHLFGGSVTSLHTGARQEVVYEEARLLMNELKTTLRYAAKDSIDPEQPTVSTSKFSYKCNLWDRHMDIAQGTNKEYKVTVEWKDDTKKQLQVTREDITDGSKKITVFPNDSNNSIFEGKFPVTSETLTLNDGNTVIMYKIALPLQYEFNGQMKTQTLETKVVPSKDEVTETPEEKMRREYMEILNTGKKIDAKEQLTSKEEKLRDDVYAFFGQAGQACPRAYVHACQGFHAGHAGAGAACRQRSHLHPAAASGHAPCGALRPGGVTRSISLARRPGARHRLESRHGRCRHHAAGHRRTRVVGGVVRRGQPGRAGAGAPRGTRRRFAR